MLKIGEVEYRNLQEQVLKNKDDIEQMRDSERLAELGIKVVNTEAPLSSAAGLPDADTYTGTYGDAYIVGAEAPFELYVYSRSSDPNVKGFWFDWGTLNAPSIVPGPIGPQGIKGDTGVRGSFWYSQTGAPTNVVGVNDNDQALDGSTGNVYQFNEGAWQLTGNIRGPQGIQGIQGIIGPVGPIGPTGPVGPKGEQGQFIEIVGTLPNTDQLPDPTTVPRYAAYLIPVVGTEHVYLIVGEGTSASPLVWHDAGGFGGGTAVFIDGVQQNQMDLSNDVVAPNYKPTENSSASVGTDAVTFNNLEVSGKNPAGSFVTPTQADIGLPIKASNNIKPVATADNKLAFDVTQAFLDKIASDIESATPQEVVINAPVTATNGQLTEEQLATLQADKGAYLFFNNEIFRLNDTQHTAGYLIYTHVGYENTTQKYIIKCITITISTRGWVLTSQEVKDNTVANNKNFYNLGIYDTYVSNGNRTAKITRRTGYLFPSDLLRFTWTYESTYKRWAAFSNQVPIASRNAFRNNLLPYYNFGIGGPDSIGIFDNGVIYIVYKEDASTKADLFNLLSNLCIQYKSKSSYTEEVIDEQSIRPATLAQEAYWDSEWKKGLNLASVKEVTAGSNIKIADNIPAGTYTFSLNDSSPVSGAQYEIRSSTALIQPGISTAQAATITLTETSNLYVYVNNVGGTTSIMLNEGTHPYPYQPYKGDLVHKKELDNYVNKVDGVIVYPDQEVTTRYVNNSAYYTDQYGNFVHNQTTASDSWGIFANSHNSNERALVVWWETGDVSIRGAVNAKRYDVNGTPMFSLSGTTLTITG